MFSHARRTDRFMAAALTMLSAMLSVATLNTAHASASRACQTMTYAKTRHIVCSFDLASVDVSIKWRDSAKKPYATLSAVRRAVEANGRRFVLATNGGMYRPDLAPVGYYVEHRKKLKNANTRGGPGNFHMRPNGIFFVENGRARVMETRAFLKRNKRPDFATQSGPMLVINGRIHPIFKHDSKSRKYRNGIAASRDGRTLHVAISDEAVTFYEFARLFKDKIKVRNALFLDGGSVPQLIGPGVARASFAPVGPVIVVTQRVKTRASGD